MTKTIESVENATAENTATENMNLPVTQESPALPYTAKDVSKRGKAIRTELQTVEKSFLKIAFNLHWFYRTKAFESVGYKNIYDMAQAEFNIKRTLTNNYINVIDRFAKRDENGEIVEEVNEIYNAFSHSQLIAMLGKSDEELEGITADMSVRKIKEALKPSEADTADDDATSDTADDGTTGDTADDGTTGDTADDGTTGDTADEKEAEITIVERQVLVRFNNMDEYNRYLDGMNDYIENALKKGKAVEVAIVK